MTLYVKGSSTDRRSQNYSERFCCDDTRRNNIFCRGRSRCRQSSFRERSSQYRLSVVSQGPKTTWTRKPSFIFLVNCLLSCILYCLFVQVFETIGPVKAPFYTVRFNSIADIEAANLSTGDDVFFAPKECEFTTYIFVNQLSM